MGLFDKMSVQSAIDQVGRNDLQNKAEIGPLIVNRYLPRFENLTDILSLSNATDIIEKAAAKFDDGTDVKVTRNSTFEFDLSKFVTSVSINETIEGAGDDGYDSCEIQLKMDIDTFRWYFGDGLGQLQTGHWITIKRPTAYYASHHNHLKLKNDPVWNDTSGIPIKSYYNHENEIIYDKNYAQLNDALQERIKAINEGTKNLKVKRSVDPAFDPVLDFLEQEKAKAIKSAQKTARIKNKENKLTNKEPANFDITFENQFACIFFGKLTNISQKFVVDADGNAGFFIRLSCESFIFDLTKSDYLSQMPERRLVLKEDVIDDNKYEYRFSRQDQIKNYGINDGAYSNAFNRILKTPEYFINLHSYFETGKNIENFEGDEVINVRTNMTNIIRSFGTNYLPVELHPFNATYGKQAEIIDEITGDVLVPNGFLTVGSIINVVTEQSHLPESCVYRQFLPMKSIIGTQFQGFKTFGVNRTQPWNLITGTFVPDPNLIECFPLLIPLINYSEILFNNTVSNAANRAIIDGLGKPIEPLLFEKVSDVIRKFYIKLGAIPCVIYRLKPLSPDLALNMKSYKDLISNSIIANEQLFELRGIKRDENKVRYGNQIKEHLAKNMEFNSEKIFLDTQNKNLISKEFSRTTSLVNQDACNSDLIPALSINDILDFEMYNDENQRINSVYVSANQNSSNNLGIPVGADAEFSTIGKVFQWYGILMDGLRLYNIQYPFIGGGGDRFTSEFLSSIAERLYSIYGEGNKYSFGTFTIIGDLSPEILKGSWIRLKFNEDVLARAYENSDRTAESLKALKNLAKYNDFYCYILGIDKNYIIDPATGLLSIRCSIRFSRGKFGLMPPLFPELFDMTTYQKPINKNKDYFDELDDVFNSPVDILLRAYRRGMPDTNREASEGVLQDINNIIWHGASAKSFTYIIDPTLAGYLDDDTFMRKVKYQDVQTRIEQIKAKPLKNRTDVQNLAFYTYLIDVLNAYDNKKTRPEFSYESYSNIYEKLE